MYVCCKGCKKTKDNEDVGIKNNGTQYKTCVNCRDKNKKDNDNKQQSIDTNVNRLCTRCCQVKPNTEFGEYEMHVYDKELKRTRQVMVTYKTCARCKEQQNKHKEYNADKNKHYNTIHKRKKLQQEVDKETEQVCSRCLKVKPKSDYGEYKTWAVTQDTKPVQ